MPLAAMSVYNCSYVEYWRGEVAYHDGDTFRCLGDVRPIAPDVREWVPKVRLARVNAPESGQDGSAEARDALIRWLQGRPFNLICYGRDKYGRLLADAERGTGLLSDHMLMLGFVRSMSAKQARELIVLDDHNGTDLLRAITHPSDYANIG